MTLITKPDFTYVWASGGAVVAPNDSKKQQGWVAEAPPFQYDNWLQNRQDQMLAHINQRGIPAWDGLTNYEAGGLSYVQGSDGKVYKSVAASGPSSVVSNPTTDVTDTYWAIAFADVGAFLTQAAGDTRYTQRSNNLSDLTNVATARINIGAAPVISPAFTGTPTAPTASVGTNTTQVATTAFVAAAEKLNAPIATVASAASIDLTSGAPNTSQITISGSAVITGFVVAANRAFIAKFTGTPTLTNNAAIVTGTGENIVLSANDSCIIRATAANVVEIVPLRITPQTFLSAALAITPGSQTILTHNLGFVPPVGAAEIYFENVVANAGWSPGDTLEIGTWNHSPDATASTIGAYLYAPTTTTITIGLGNGSSWQVPAKTTGVATTITLANWRLRVRIKQ